MGYDKRVRPNYGGKLDASYPGKLFVWKYSSNLSSAKFTTNIT